MRTRDPKKEAAVKKHAIQLIVDDGLKGFSMQKLANKCKISVATLYIYYENKEDLIRQLGQDIAADYSKTALENFSADMNFADGIRLQWRNRLKFATKDQTSLKFFEILRHSPYSDAVLSVAFREFGAVMVPFLEKAVRDKQLKPLPMEVFWGIAFGPLYILIPFHQTRMGFGKKPFEISDEIFDQCIDSILLSLKPNES